jgi:predicted aldo/keto reductase-like oxidoreductase
MDKVRLGKSELMVTRIGFGGIPIQRDSEDEAIAVVKKCLDLGVAFLDTAHAYTTSEGRIGKAISGRREGLILATKSPARESEEMRSHLNLSLERLGVEYIDLFQFHNVSDSKSLERVLDPKGPMTVLEEAKKEGKIGHIGATSHQIDMAKELIKSDRFETIMFPFNFISHEPASELLPLAKQHDVGFIAMKPFGGGVLDNATLALKFLLQFPDVVPIPGIQQTNEIEEIIQILNGPWQLTEAEQNEIQRLREELGTRFCRRCDYCQPCPQGVAISMVNGIPSMLKTQNHERLFYGSFKETLETAALCSKCGECEKKCPYNLPIMDMMEEYYNLYEAEKEKYDMSISK